MNIRNKACGTTSFSNFLGWNQEIAAIIEDPDSEELPKRLVRALTSLVSFELAAVLVYRGRARPLNIYDNFELANGKRGITAYINNTYILNPFYQASQKHLADGVYRMRDLAPDALFERDYFQSYRIFPRHSEEIGYLTEDWPEGFEEVDIAINLAPDLICELSIYRSVCSRGFTDEELAWLTTVVPVVGVLLRCYWAASGIGIRQMTFPGRRFERLLTSFGSSILTERERSVVGLILRGHSSRSIGLNLGIALGTVKTHRKNAYAKLRISSQSELLSRFLKSWQHTYFI